MQLFEKSGGLYHPALEFNSLTRKKREYRSPAVYNRNITSVLLVIIFLLFGLSARKGYAQSQPLINSTLNGKVFDAQTKEPIVGVTLKINGVTHSVATDEKGNFNFITGQKLPYTLTVSYIGYKSQQVVANGSPLYIYLQQDISQLNDVVIVGYGTQKKSQLTGSISSVPKQSLNQVSASVDNLLRGAVPGIQVTQSSGQPGASASIRIRGGNSITGGNEPLYVIDGFPVYNDNGSSSTNAGTGAGLNALSTINPSDIESIDVLKDASATAIYGSRGANGVILITTKKGKKGSDNVSYGVSIGNQKVTKTIPLLDAQQWARLRNDILASSGQAPSFTDDQIAALGKGADWERAGLKESLVQNHELSFSGGDEKSRYAISGNYYSQDGVLLKTDFSRYSLRVNYERDVSSKFKIGLNTFGSRSNADGAAGNTNTTAFISPNVITGLLFQPPAVAVKNADGSYNVTNPYSTTPYNPLQDIVNTVNQTHVNRTLGSFYGEYKLIEGLTAKVSVGADLINTKQNYYAPANTLNGYTSQGIASVGNKFVNTYLNENTLTYDKKLNDKNSINILLGNTTQFASSESAVAGSTKFVTDATSYNSLQSGALATKPYSDSYDWALNSYFARASYSYLQKYNITISARADGSSRFGSGNKWGYFPSAGLSWNISKENFLKSVTAVTNLKLRLSAGSTGNQEIGQYLSLATVSPVNYNFNRTLYTGFGATRISNPDLKWEKTTQYDAGIDLGLLDNRITFVFDAYYKKTNDLLLNLPLPVSSGFANSLQNVGSVENKGLEIALSTDNIRGEFTWKSTVVYSLNRNKVLSLGGGRTSFFPDLFSLSQTEIIKVGQPIGTFYGYKTNGIFQSTDNIASLPTIDPANTKPGDRRYVDVVPDGKITAADKVILGNAQPKFSGSFTNTFTYKNFELNVFLQGVYGNSIYNGLQQQLETTSLSTNASAEVANRWTPTNPSNVIPRAANSPVVQISDRFVQSGSYLRLKNISLGYNLPQSLFSKIGAKNLRIYVSAQNLVTWTKYKGFDPEVSTYEQNNIAPGIDNGVYPNYKSFIAGLNVSF